MLLRIEGFDLPGHHCAPGGDFPGAQNVHVAVQRKDKPAELLDVQPGDAETVAWEFECEPFTDKDGVLKLRGPYIQNRIGGRFVYLSWGEVGADGSFKMFRRSKLFLRDVTPEVMAAAVASGTLVARMRLTNHKGHPGAADLVWSAA